LLTGSKAHAVNKVSLKIRQQTPGMQKNLEINCQWCLLENDAEKFRQAKKAIEQKHQEINANYLCCRQLKN
jgi:hypothetical protein